MDYFRILINFSNQTAGNWGNPRSRDDNVLESNDWLPGHTAVDRISPRAEPIQHTQSPIVTGTSVLAIKYKDGIMMSTDTLASYGSMAQIRDMKRMIPVGSFSVVGASGDIIDEYQKNDGHELAPSHIYEFLGRLMYSRRSKSDPLWNSLVIGGVKQGKSFLGLVDLQGTSYESSTIATGYGAHIAQPLLRKAVEGKESVLTEVEARKLLEDCMRVLFYRDARSLDTIQIATINDKGATITEPFKLATEWAFAENIRGYGA